MWQAPVARAVHVLSSAEEKTIQSQFYKKLPYHTESKIKVVSREHKTSVK